MDPVFTKLNLKDEAEIVVLNAPASFRAALASLRHVRVCSSRSELRASATLPESIAFALAFCVTQAEVDAATRVLTERASADCKLWFAYPKQTSKRYQCEFNRDTGWAAVDAAGYKGVRMIAIDEDWSALRFRRVAETASKAPAKKK